MECTINMDNLQCNSSYNFTSKLLQVVIIPSIMITMTRITNMAHLDLWP